MLNKNHAVPAILTLAMLTACGSDGDGAANVSQVDLGEPPVFADGTIIADSDFRSETFPFYFVEGFTEGGTPILRRGAGTATVSSDGNGLVLAIGDGEFIELDRVSGSFFDTASGIDFLVEDLGVSRTVSLDDPALLGDADIVGTFGFQTPSGFMPSGTTATYDFGGFSRVLLNETGDDFLAVLDDADGVDLFADFRNGEISGTLFNASGFVDVDGDNFRDDNLSLFIALENGRISGGTFSGTLSGDAVAFIDDSTFFDLNPTFTSTRADGVFFGNGASRIGGTFEGNYRSAGPDGSFVGYFDVGVD